MKIEQEKITKRLKELEGWQLSADGKKIGRSFDFKNFREAVEFVIGLADFAEKINHYPAVMTIRLQEVIVEFTTPAVEGLSENDFILAGEANQIAGWKIKLERFLMSPQVLIPLIIMLLTIILWQRLG